MPGRPRRKVGLGQLFESFGAEPVVGGRKVFAQHGQQPGPVSMVIDLQAILGRERLASP
ncbi:hypothetical protein D9M68_508760 [compost metagenome]